MSPSAQNKADHCAACGAPLPPSANRSGGGTCMRCAFRNALDLEGGPHAASAAETVIVTRPLDADDGALPRFGDYQLLEEIARGGMGVVYRARQVSLDRIVAVKMLLFGPMANKEFVQRFRVEASAAASLQHPNIVAVHEVGVHQNQHYLVMDYIAGQTLAKLSGGAPLPPRRAAAYVKSIAQAIHYAHEQGVLHRDLKPSNVLIDLNDEPHVMDFGLAKRLDADSDLTLSGQILGSPNYMSPEQAGGKRGKVGRSSDVYSLGAVLFHLLTGRPPFVAENVSETIQLVLEREPITPRALVGGVPRDLETLCLKCLEKEPTKRYASAQELADELNRYLHDEPIHARPVSAPEKTWRWCRRKPVLTALIAAIAILLVSVTAVSFSAARKIAAEARRTTEKARELRLQLYVADMNVAYQAIQEDNLARARQILTHYLPQARSTGDRTSPRNQEDLRGWEWRYLWSLSRDDSMAVLGGHTNAVTCAVFTPDGGALITASFDQSVRIWDMATRQTVRIVTGFRDKLQRNSVALSPDGRLLAIADGTDIHVFETFNWGRLRILTNSTLPGYIVSLPIAFSPDGRTLSCNAETEIRHWDTTTWMPRTSRPSDLADEFTRLLTYSPDGRHFATARQDGVAVWDAQSSPPRQRFLGQLRWPFAAVFSPDGKRLAAGGVGEQAIVWDIETGTERVRLPLGLRATLGTAVVWSPDGKQLAVGSDQQTIHVWDMERGKLRSTLRGYSSGVLVFSPDGGTLVSGVGNDIRLFPISPRNRPGSSLTLGRLMGCSRDGSNVIVWGTNSTVSFWDARSRSLVRRFNVSVVVGPRDRIQVSLDGSLMAHADGNGSVRVWKCATGEQLGHLSIDPAPKWPRLDFAPDNRLLAISDETRSRGGSGLALLWDPQSGERRALPGADVYRPVFSPDGSMLAAGYGYGVRIWSVAGLRTLATIQGTIQGLNSTINGIAFSLDGALVAAMDRGGQISLLEIATGRRRTFDGPASGNYLSAAAFSPDGRTLISGSNVSPELWNVATGKRVLTLVGTRRYLNAMMFSPDGRTLLLGAPPGAMIAESIDLIEAPSLAEIEAAEGL